jgi:hydroxymethylbilane synthase
MRVTIASRRSDLARIQAFQVGETLLRAHPELEINYSFHESLGDKNLNDPLWKMPEKGVFTQDFREGLLRGDFDLVVHSWKDLAIEVDPETEIVATLPRADARDLLLVRRDRWAEVKRTGVMSILTSSPRRAYNLGSFLRDALPAKINELKFENVRGNVQTRVRKMLEQNVDGLIVAKAAIDRLLSARAVSEPLRVAQAGGPNIAALDEFAETRTFLAGALSQCLWMVLPLSANPSAPAQGALAIEISRQREDMRALVAPLNSADTFTAVEHERAILRAYGGGCHQKIGVSVVRRDFGEVTFLRGLTDDGVVLNSRSITTWHNTKPAKVPREQLWPLNSKEAHLFDIERVAIDPLSLWERVRVRAEVSSQSSAPSTQPSPTGRRSEDFPSLWIAKADALPENWTIADRQIVWTSGLHTWKRLAQRGVWVNGSAESLGEHEPTRIETIAGPEIKWLKLTHDRGYEGDMPTLATYRLVPRNDALDLTGRKHFFWKSGSSFEYALSQNPWLKEMNHYCGPGNTQRILRQHGIAPVVFLDHEQWLKEIAE